jgi:heme/copper-type cytochrome/quinol oxidase subunit 2
MRQCADGAGRRRLKTQLTQEKGGAMHTWIDGWGWLWMTLMMGFWLVVLGAVIYIAVRLAHRPPAKPRAES